MGGKPGNEHLETRATACGLLAATVIRISDSSLSSVRSGDPWFPHPLSLLPPLSRELPDLPTVCHSRGSVPP